LTPESAANNNPGMKFRSGFFLTLIVWLVAFFLNGGRGRLVAQLSSTSALPGAATTSNSGGSPQEQIAALELEMTNAYQRVLQIVNQPVRALARAARMRVATYNEGWFHPGATKPDFNTVDIRQSQELIYATNQYVTSNLNPGVVFLGQELEFNAMTKLFYTNRSLPKHKLSEAEMLEINQLYRVIGRCELGIKRIQGPAALVNTKPIVLDEGDAETHAGAGGLVERIRGIPAGTRVLYGGGAIVLLIIVASALRLMKRKSD
jgi:hypothetical protein